MKQPANWQVYRQCTHVWKEAVSPDHEASIMTWPVDSDYHEKQGRSTGRVVLGSLFIYLKRHWKLSWWRGLLARWWPHQSWSPGAVEWNNLQWAQSQGFLVPEPLAMGQIIGPGCKLQSYLAIRELTGMLPLHQAIPDAYAKMATPQFQLWKQTLLERVAGISRKLHTLHHYHKDLYLCHFYVNTPSVQQTDPGDVVLIDLHRLAHHRWFGWRMRIKDLAQLFFSMWGIAGLEGADRLTFFHRYLGQQELAASDRWLFLAAMRKAERYARHNGIDTDITQASIPQSQAA
jgi:hypothetical protein